MEHEEIQQIFERFFEKYRKHESDEDPNWSAYWTEFTEKGKFEVRMIKAPGRLTFSFFNDDRKLAEVEGWDTFFDASKSLEQDDSNGYDEARFFAGMQEAVS